MQEVALAYKVRSPFAINAKSGLPHLAAISPAN